MSLAAIHILKKELCLTDAEYRDVLRDVAGVESAKFLSDDGDRAVMRALYTIRDQRRAAEKERPKSPEERKVWGLWYELKGYLPEEKRNAAYLAGFAERFGLVKKTGGSVSFELFEPPEFHKLIEALKCRLTYEEQRLAAEVPF